MAQNYAIILHANLISDLTYWTEIHSVGATKGQISITYKISNLNYLGTK